MTVSTPATRPRYSVIFLQPHRLHLTVVTSLLLLFAPTLRAQLMSISDLIEVQTDNGSYRQYRVNCGASSPPRFIRKQSGSPLWCDSVLSDYCADRRIAAADLVCEQRYFAELSEYELNQRAGETNDDGNRVKLDDNLSASTATAPANSTATSTARLAPKAEPAQELPSNATMVSSSTVSQNNGRSPEVSAAQQVVKSERKKTKLELLQELQIVEQELLSIQSRKLALQEQDLQLLKQQLEETN